MILLMFDNRIERFFNYTTLTMRITLDSNCPGGDRTHNIQINGLPFYHWTTRHYRREAQFPSLIIYICLIPDCHPGLPEISKHSSIPKGEVYELKVYTNVEKHVDVLFK